MRHERLAWGGNLILAAIATYLAALQVTEKASMWVFIAIGFLGIAAAILLFPYSSNADGQAQRLAGIRFRGSGNKVQSAGANSSQLINTGDGAVHIENRPRVLDQQ